MARVIGSGLEAHIYQETRSRALEILADAKKQAEHLIREAEEDARQSRERAVSRATRELDAKRRQAFAHARLLATREAVNRQEELLQRLWHEAESRLRALAGGDPQERLALLERLVRDAAQQMGGGELELAVSPDDAPLLSESVLADMAHRLAPEGVQRLTLAQQPADIWGGVIVRKVGTKELVNNSLGARLELARRALRDEVGHLLSPPSGPEPSDATHSDGGLP